MQSDFAAKFAGLEEFPYDPISIHRRYGAIRDHGTGSTSKE
ncbi:MAG: hypothetical protein WCP20_10045 [Desulfuromonadales bacterium]